MGIRCDVSQLDDMNKRIAAKLESITPKKEKRKRQPKYLKVRVENTHARYISPETAAYINRDRDKDADE